MCLLCMMLLMMIIVLGCDSFSVVLRQMVLLFLFVLMKMKLNGVLFVLMSCVRLFFVLLIIIDMICVNLVCVMFCVVIFVCVGFSLSVMSVLFGGNVCVSQIVLQLLSVLILRICCVLWIVVSSCNSLFWFGVMLIVGSLVVLFVVSVVLSMVLDGMSVVEKYVFIWFY